ncbi:hypothetical protein E1301_Tti023821 [Triplophysa tibetana]|uniref:Ig-like domain-containing protein n=1 Tax=Triplophysa tibetana TaxID=1572043 RepID=A0A5A9NMV1_9TELE|nr:hypothetical protein E1301_Tti022386 [Triplophysa tibetana]KAA0710789.1 hypothetical protein E1301_Tti023821 [Triplophysa tibetana]
MQKRIFILCVIQSVFILHKMSAHWAFLFLSLYGFILTAHALQDQRVRLNGMGILSCGDMKEGKVTWSRFIHGSQVFILSTDDDGQIIRHAKNNNHSVLPDLSLIVWFVTPQDEGLYYCNGKSVACLTVKSANGQSPEDQAACLTDALSVMERVLMFSGVGLAAFMFLVVTVIALKKRQLVFKTDTAKHQNEMNYINLRPLHL